MADKMPEWLTKVMEGKLTAADSWAMLSGYVAQMVREGSEDAGLILGYMHELRPATRFFTGTVAELRGEGAD
jgi:hypothetical protein